MIIDEVRPPDLTVELLDDKEQLAYKLMLAVMGTNVGAGYPHRLAVKLCAAEWRPYEVFGKTERITALVPTELTVVDGAVLIAVNKQLPDGLQLVIKVPEAAAGMSLADLARLPLQGCELTATGGDTPACDFLLDHSSQLFNQAKSILGKRGNIIPQEGGYAPDFPYCEVGKEGSKVYSRFSYIGAELDPKKLPTGEELSRAIAAATDKLPTLGLDERDVLTFITDAWLRSGGDSYGRFAVTAKDYYELRGIKKKKSGSGREGGYGKYFDDRFKTALYNLSSIWVQTPGGAEVYKSGKRARTKVWRSPIITVTGDSGDMDKNFVMSTNSVSIMFGDMFAEVLKHHSGFLYTPVAVLALDPDRQRIEKSLAYYLSYLWRVRACKGELGQAYTVKLLLENGDMEVGEHRPGRARERLEAALDTLEANKIIAGWQYRKEDFDAVLPRQDWLPTWLKWRIEIAPPAKIIELYSTIQLPNHKPVVLPEGKPKAQALADRLRAVAKAKCLTQLMLAEEIDMSQGKLSQILSGKRLPGRQLYAKIEKWLADNE